MTIQLYRSGAHPSKNLRSHLKHNRQDRDLDHAPPHPGQGAASRNCSARGIAQARSVAPPKGCGCECNRAARVWPDDRHDSDVAIAIASSPTARARMQSCERSDGNALGWPIASRRAPAGYSLGRSGAGRCAGDPAGLGSMQPRDVPTTDWLWRMSGVRGDRWGDRSGPVGGWVSWVRGRPAGRVWRLERRRCRRTLRRRA